ncbi:MULTISPECIES: ABC transporter ATP-binding protein [Agrobacterium tumefaciens complex]|jgi:lactose/L-arabinose transport system ATP-binding protein|uniref:Lactose/L-arabinose transport system ATP-binding protein n=3 Tax=Agrobacterium tumefaciens complex TaxID=1183400 RepID=A0AAW8M0T4_AGRTU|nr:MULTISPECIES: sn-glycerol-3-phosphate ABC transporter ATP-binding protein UgpC [Agrobacterium tumefaciens complex]TGE76778.1 sn-glycerol-3-phosphate ABC transporter ATP-binding protein UgpC [Rhizobium sp. SEMIA 439]AYM82952.1 lactose/L-arabinose transport system ATP-binding protein [Agrobacterium tumefaciens]EPR14014.1 sugar ABC transporter ATP-binding protein [Agrobacterium radiobacter DSM 30147]KAB0456261.1 sn-glycerol-3-phosphate ABC transporter ATP-binding protein UgpC [Agrobacterium tum
MAELSLKNVVKRYGALEVIHGADLDIADGEFVVFVGPSGCGKSTLLRMIAGLEDISDGDVSIGGRTVNDADPADRGIAMVFQSYALYPHMTVAENLSFGLRMNGNPKADTQKRVNRAAEILQINELMERRPKQLSGGQRQRVAIGRAIVREPQVFLFDEPLSNLDAELRVQMRVEISRLHKQLGTTMIYVTHDQTEAMTLADKIVVLRAGNIEQVGAPLDLYDDPANRFVAGFVGSPKMNFLDATIIGSGADSVTLSLDSDPAVRLTLPTKARLNDGARVSLGIRPEHFSDAGQGDADLTVHVDVAEHLGNTSYVYARTEGGEQLIIERPESRDVGNRDRLTVGLSARRAFLFDSKGERLR